MITIVGEIMKVMVMMVRSMIRMAKMMVMSMVMMIVMVITVIYSLESCLRARARLKRVGFRNLIRSVRVRQYLSSTFPVHS